MTKGTTEMFDQMDSNKVKSELTRIARELNALANSLTVPKTASEKILKAAVEAIAARSMIL